MANKILRVEEILMSVIHEEKPDNLLMIQMEMPSNGQNGTC